MRFSIEVNPRNNRIYDKRIYTESSFDDYKLRNAECYTDKFYHHGFMAIRESRARFFISLFKEELCE
jgi:hypothetical protein